MAERIALASHENSDFSGYVGTPIMAGEYTAPEIGLASFGKVAGSLSAPTTYTHPKTSVPGMVRKGFVNSRPAQAGKVKNTMLRGYNPDNREVLYAPRGKK